jgi:uncharacterized repeat protein (TIGR01451 family)
VQTRPIALAALTTIILTLTLAASAASPGGFVDIYIRGYPGKRVPGRNAAFVDIRWDFKCFADRLGPATYSWTLRVVRLLPKPEQTRTLMSGTSKSGSARVRLAPGRYEPRAEPFRCETERGAGSTEPEIGAQFVVPDYCPWTVTGVRGAVTLERAGLVKRAAATDLVRPGDVLVTRRGGGIALRSREGGTTVALARSSRLTVDRAHCARTGGWKLRLARGKVSARLAEENTRAPYEIATPDALARAARARWTTEVSGTGRSTWTRVRVQEGRVAVRSRATGRSRTIAAGRKTVVRARAGAGVRLHPAIADIAATIEDSPDPVPLGGEVTYRITVANNGPDEAQSVVAVDALPPGASLVRIEAATARCTAQELVRCEFGYVGIGESRAMTVVARPLAGGQLLDVVSSCSDEIDPVRDNNSAAATTTVAGASAPSGTSVVSPPACTSTSPSTPSARDTRPPTVRALASSGKPGKPARLRYRVSDDSGMSREEVTIYRRGRRLKRIASSLDAADARAVVYYFVTWKVPKKIPRGVLRFCVRATDAAGNRSRPSCAPLRVT